MKLGDFAELFFSVSRYEFLCTLIGWNAGTFGKGHIIFGIHLIHEFQKSISCDDRSSTYCRIFIFCFCFKVQCPDHFRFPAEIAVINRFCRKLINNTEIRKARFSGKIDIGLVVKFGLDCIHVVGLVNGIVFGRTYNQNRMRQKLFQLWGNLPDLGIRKGFGILYSKCPDPVECRRIHNRCGYADRPEIIAGTDLITASLRENDIVVCLKSRGIDFCIVPLKYDFSSYVVDLSCLYEVNLWPYGYYQNYLGHKRLTPFLQLGIGMTFVGQDKSVTANVPLGVGVKYRLGKRVNLTFDWRWHFTLSDKVDGLEAPHGISASGFKNKDSYQVTMLTLTYSFSAICPNCNKD